MIEEKRLYPITFLKGLNVKNKNKLTSKGIFLLKQLIERHPAELRRQSGSPRENFDSILDNARVILSRN